jgi:2-polyprenyl-3-methyl-5-hydroxy-6-metoxy-1,4-benzoquinol methylase
MRHNFKLLFPTYRTRERFVQGALEGLGPRPLGRMLNVGSGEGDIDPLLASYAAELESGDVNAADVEHARAMNAAVPNVRYSVLDGERLAYADASFDVVVCLEVIEHVGDPVALLAELARVLRPGGRVVLTCPSARFPVSYDPINAALAATGTHVSAGAYGYGHSWLVDDAELERWLAGAGLEVARKDRLSGWLVGAVECYWPGLLQRAFKANAANTEGEARRAKVRPTAEPPPFLGVVDRVIALDRRVSSGSERSVGLGYVLAKTAGKNCGSMRPAREALDTVSAAP